MHGFPRHSGYQIGSLKEAKLFLSLNIRNLWRIRPMQDMFQQSKTYCRNVAILLESLPSLFIFLNPNSLELLRQSGKWFATISRALFFVQPVSITWLGSLTKSQYTGSAAKPWVDVFAKHTHVIRVQTHEIRWVLHWKVSNEGLLAVRSWWNCRHWKYAGVH